jgi:hypothetical protein
MGVSGGPYIVRDSSLVLELDAADRNSYVSGSLIWNSLTLNGNSGSLINGVQFNTQSSALVFDGTNDYLRLNKHYISESYCQDLQNQKWTVEFWYDIQAVGNSQYAVGPYGVLGFGLYFEFGSSNKGLMWTDGGLFLYSNSPLTGIGRAYVVMVFDGSSTQRSQYIYLNGKLDATRTDVGSYTFPGYATNNFYIAGEGGVGTCSGSIFSSKLYLKALSAQEVLQNYNAQKSRFGLK